MAASARNYLIVTASYWGFTLVDGALRMLVLFHFSKLGYSPFTLAFLFLLYEFAGIIAMEADHEMCGRGTGSGHCGVSFAGAYHFWRG